MNNLYFSIITRFILLVLIQGLIFSKFDLFGIYDPYICLVFILIFPIKVNRIIFLLTSFVFGITLDLFTSSYGINAAACLSIAFLRPYILNFVFGSFFDPRGVKMMKHYLLDSSIYQKIIYLFVMIFSHHFFMFSLEAFSLNHLPLIFVKTINTSILSLIFCSTFIYLLVQNEK